MPGDVSVVGFDDIPEAEHFAPPLTTVRQDFDALGRDAMAAVLAVLGDEQADDRPVRARARRAREHTPARWPRSPVPVACRPVACRGPGGTQLAD